MEEAVAVESTFSIAAGDGGGALVVRTIGASRIAVPSERSPFMDMRKREVFFFFFFLFFFFFF